MAKNEGIVKGLPVPNTTEGYKTTTQKVIKDDQNVRLSDLPENYFDDLLDMDFFGNNNSNEKEPEIEILPSIKISKNCKITF